MMLRVPMTDAAHTSIRDPQSVARLSGTFSRSLSTADLAEPLASLDDNQQVTLGAELTCRPHVSVLGVRRAELVAGSVTSCDPASGTLGEHAREFRREEVLDESASLDVVLGALATAEQVFNDRLTHDIGKLRNHLAHAQELEAEHLATAARLASFIHSILRAKGVQRIVALRCEMAAPEGANSITSP